MGTVSSTNVGRRGAYMVLVGRLEIRKALETPRR
jgi:hypothetical protein